MTRITKHTPRNCKLATILAALVITALSARYPAAAQLTTATLAGTITDTTGAALPDATITIINADTHFRRIIKADGRGEYRADLLPIGNYAVTVEMTGFEKFLQQNISLSVNEEAHLNASLTIGSTSQEVIVTEAPPAINLENATIGRTISTEDVENFPILDRNIYSLLPLVPGVQSATASNTLGYPQEVVQINGSTTENNTGAVSYYLDGGLDMTALRMTGNQMPNPEALAQFNVQTSNYSATYGRMSGGVVSAVTKSGTNNFHGTLYEFNRETNFNSDPWHGARAPIHRNFFGGVIGGPIVRNKTFFFFDYAGFRDEASQNFTGSAILPTAKEEVGNFSEFLPATSGSITTCTQTLSAADKAAGDFIVCDPTTRKPYAGNIITDPLDSVAQNILKSLPAANRGNTLAPSYVGNVPLPNTYNEYMGKIDHQLTNNQRFVGSYFYLKGQNTIFPGSGNMPWGLQLQTYVLDVVNLSDTMTLGPNTINQVWATYTRSLGGRVNTPEKSLTDFGSSFAIQGQPNLPQITVTNYFSLTNAISGPRAGTDYYSVRDLFIWNRGGHALQLGGEGSLNKDVQLTLSNNYGVFGFQSSTSARTGNALADYMLGLPNSQSQAAPVTASDNSFFYSLFAQDDWRVTPRLTINAGLRWDIQTPPTDPENKESTFIQGQQSTVNPAMPLGELVVGDSGITRGIVPIRFQHLSPRLGLAWDPFGVGKTSIRAAAGVFWGGVSGNEWNSTTNDYPFTLNYTFGVPGTLANPYKNTPSPFPFVYTPGNVAPAPAGTAIFGMAPDFQWPYTYQLTASVQQELSNTLVVGIAYVGSLARDLPFNSDQNAPVFNAASPASNTTTNVNARRPIDTGVLGQVNQIRSDATSNYNSLQVTFRKEMRYGISFNGFYAWSKAIESYSLDGSATAEDEYNLKLEKGPTSNDLRNIFVTSVVWQPNYVKTNHFASVILNGWTVSPIIKLNSGSPFSVTTGTDANNNGISPDRANQIGNPYDQSINHSSRAAELVRSVCDETGCSHLPIRCLQTEHGHAVQHRESDLEVILSSHGRPSPPTKSRPTVYMPISLAKNLSRAFGTANMRCSSASIDMRWRGGISNPRRFQRTFRNRRCLFPTSFLMRNCSDCSMPAFVVTVPGANCNQLLAACSSCCCTGLPCASARRFPLRSPT